jgi:hypothetical protein
MAARPIAGLGFKRALLYDEATRLDRYATTVVDEIISARYRGVSSIVAPLRDGLRRDAHGGRGQTVRYGEAGQRRKEREQSYHAARRLIFFEGTPLLRASTPYILQLCREAHADD